MTRDQTIDYLYSIRCQHSGLSVTLDGNTEFVSEVCANAIALINHTEHWIPYMAEKSYGTVNRIKCSGCGNNKIDFGEDSRPRYCCDCGAYMGGDSNA